MEKPQAQESLVSYLDRMGLLGQGFAFSELVKPGQRKFSLPPRKDWQRFAGTLAMAIAFRARCMLELPGFRGFRVAAFNRETGTDYTSQHEYGRAIDLDVIGDVDRRAYYRLAVRFWCKIGASTKMGLGLYTSTYGLGGIRVHLDQGWRCRSWQGVGTGFKQPYKFRDSRGRTINAGLAVKLAVDMKLDVPSLLYM